MFGSLARGVERCSCPACGKRGGPGKAQSGPPRSQRSAGTRDFSQLGPHRFSPCVADPGLSGGGLFGERRTAERQWLPDRGDQHAGLNGGSRREPRKPSEAKGRGLRSLEE